MSNIRTFMVLAVAGLAIACGGADERDTGGSTSGGSGSTGSRKSGSRESSEDPDERNSNSGEEEEGPTQSTSPTEPAKKDYGAQCKSSADCKSDFCVFTTGSIGMCTQTCDSDLDCPGLDSQCVRVDDAPQKVCVPK